MGKQKRNLKLHIRWMIRRDMPEVLEIENESFEFTWSNEDFIRCLRKRNCIGMVVEEEAEPGEVEKVVGFTIYDLNNDHLHVLNFAVAQDKRRTGVGRAIAEKLIGKLKKERRNRIVVEIRESNLQAQVVFGKYGFKATAVLRDYYEETNDDAYVMQYQIGGQTKPMAISTNRISEVI